MDWSDYEDRYGESQADFAEDDSLLYSWREDEAEAAGVPLYGQI